MNDQELIDREGQTHTINSGEFLCKCGERYDNKKFCDICQQGYCPSCIKPANDPRNNMEFEVCLGCLEILQEEYENKKDAKKFKDIIERLKLIYQYLEGSNISNLKVMPESLSDYYQLIEKHAQVRGLIKSMLESQK